MILLSALFFLSTPLPAAVSPAEGRQAIDFLKRPAPDSTMPVQADPPVPDKNAEPPDLFRSGVRMVASLVLVIGIMLLIAYGAKRFLARKGTLPGREAMIRLVATRYLGSKSSLNVVDVDGERFVIGVSPQGISFLTTLRNGTGTAPEGGEKSFRKVLQGKMNG